MKKFLILTIKRKYLFNNFGDMIYGKLLKAYENEILDNKIFIMIEEWDDTLKGQIIIEMEASEEEIAVWTKQSLREKIGMGMARLAIKVEVRDAPVEESQA